MQRLWDQAVFVPPDPTVPLAESEPSGSTIHPAAVRRHFRVPKHTPTLVFKYA